MSIKRYTAAGSGVMRTDPKGGYINYSDYLELQNQPDALTAYLYAAELAKDDIKTLKAEVNRLTLLQVETLNERNKAEAEVERLRKFNDEALAHIAKEERKSRERLDMAQAEVERLRKAGDAMATTLKDGGIIVSGYILADEWFKVKCLAAKEGKPSV